MPQVIICTGTDVLDDDLSMHFPESKIINYREILLKLSADVIIISENLDGSIEFDKLLFELKKQDKRIILLLDSIENPMFYKALKIGVYDILFDKDSASGIDIPDIIDIYNNPKRMSHFHKYVAAMGDIEVIPSKINDITVTEESDNEADKTSPVNPTPPKSEIKFVRKKVIENKYIKSVKVTIINNTEFACEFAYNIARFNKNAKVVLLNLDFLTGYIDIYYGMKSKMKPAENSENEGYPSSERNFTLNDLKNMDMSLFENKLYYKVLNNLFVISTDTGYDLYEKHKKFNPSFLIDSCFDVFDVTIINLGLDMDNDYFVHALKKVKSCIIAEKASSDRLRAIKNYVDFCNKKHSVPTEKFSYIAYEYKKGINLSKLILRKIYKDNFLGTIDYNNKRESYRDNEDDNMFFAKYAFDENKNTFEKILKHFDIIPETTFADRIKGIISKHIPLASKNTDENDEEESENDTPKPLDTDGGI